MALLPIIVLAVVQSATEFLPVSSSGHLAITEMLLRISEGNVALTVGLHAGTLLSVLVYYRRDLIDLAFNGPRALLAPCGLEDGHFSTRGRRNLILGIIAGTIPTGIIGLALKDVVESWTTHAVVVGVFLLASGAANFVVAYQAKKVSGLGPEKLTWWHAVLIGIAQGLAVMPGLSRSGSTIAAGTALGLDKNFAARFSFLLSIPAVAGAIILYSRELTGGTGTIDPVPMAIGTLTAFVVGLGALHLLITVLKKGRFSIFGWYCCLLGPTVIVLGLLNVL